MKVDSIHLPRNTGDKGCHRAMRLEGCIYVRKGRNGRHSYTLEINYKNCRFRKSSEDIAYLQELQHRITERANEILASNNHSMQELICRYEMETDSYKSKVRDIKLDALKIENGELHDIAELFKAERKMIEDLEDDVYYTYILRLEGYNLYKIGMSKDIKKRMQQYCNASHTLIAVKDDNIEGLIKYIYDGKRVYGSEEYRFTEKEINAIIDSYHFRRL